MLPETKFQASHTNTSAVRVWWVWSATPTRRCVDDRSPKPSSPPRTAHRRSRRPPRRLATRVCSSSPEQASHIVQYVAGEKTVPDDEAEQRRDGGAGRSEFRFERRSPDQPVKRQHAKSNRDELL